MSIFRKYSAYYDLFYRNKDYKSEADYIYKVITRYSGKPSTILNLGCGTGNHDFFLADHGVRLTAVDASPEAIKKAKSKLKEKHSGGINFVRGDIRKLNLHKRFDSAIALFHVINYLNSNEDLLSCFQSVHKHLKKGSLFVFDSWYGPALFHDPPAVRTKVAVSKDYKVTRKAVPTLYPNENIAAINFDCKVQATNRKLIDSFTETHKMRYLFLPETEMMLNLSNFDLLHTEEWMTGRPAGWNSWYVLFVARKR